MIVSTFWSVRYVEHHLRFARCLKSSTAHSNTTRASPFKLTVDSDGNNSKPYRSSKTDTKASTLCSSPCWDEMFCLRACKWESQQIKRAAIMKAAVAQVCVFISGAEEGAQPRRHTAAEAEPQCRWRQRSRGCSVWRDIDFLCDLCVFLGGLCARMASARDSLMETTAWASASGSAGPPRNSSAPPLCGKGQRVEGTSMLKQICRCCSPSSLHALTLEAAAQLKSGRGGWCEYVKQRKCEFPCTYLLLVLCFPSNHNQPFCTWKCAGVKQWVLLYVLIDGQGIFTKHSCDLASLLLCDWLSFQ